MAALSLATDLGIGVPFEHGLQSTLVAMRLGQRLGVDSDTASQTYYACLLFYVGCTADAEVAAETFGDDDALTTHAMPARLGSRPEMVAGMMRALASSGSPAPVRIASVARDATFQRMLGGPEFAAGVVRKRAGGAFDPDVATPLADGAAELLAFGAAVSAWEETLACEPDPRLTLEGESIDRALGAMGDFADLASPYLVGHSAGVAELATAAAQQCHLKATELVRVRRGALVHDLGRVAVPVRIWQKPAPLTPDDWERVRLHAYHSERVLARSPSLGALAPVASFHHERLDGSGYHRGTAAAAITPPARLLAAADAYHAMTEPRPHRAALAPGQAAEALGLEASAGRLDPDAVTAVLEAAGQRIPRLERPAGLTEREAEVIGLLARGLQTKQVARRLGISVKTADHHVQNAYAKIGVSTRAAAALFAMEHGLTAWGELPIGRARDRS
jgi:DNA-binding CsgD family transcriptional regulator